MSVHRVCKECIAQAAEQRGPEWLASLTAIKLGEDPEYWHFDAVTYAEFLQRTPPMAVPVQSVAQPCCNQVSEETVQEALKPS